MNEDLMFKMFAAGAYSAIADSGMSDKEAMGFVGEVCKQAAARGRRDYDDDDDDEDRSTWWSRNKGWALPTAVGLSAFILGGNAGRYGPIDRNYFENLLSGSWNAMKSIAGISKGGLSRSLTEIDEDKLKAYMKATSLQKAKQMAGQSSPGDDLDWKEERARLMAGS